MKMKTVMMRIGLNRRLRNNSDAINDSVISTPACKCLNEIQRNRRGVKRSNTCETFRFLVYALATLSVPWSKRNFVSRTCSILGMLVLISFWNTFRYFQFESIQRDKWLATLLTPTHNVKPSTQIFPRILGYFPIEEENVPNFSFPLLYQFVRIDPTLHYNPPKRKLAHLGDWKAQSTINEIDDFYGYSYNNPDITEECKLKYSWQKTSMPTCNSFHEFDIASPFLTNVYDTRLRKKYNIIGEGFWRSVFVINLREYIGWMKLSSTFAVFKSMKYMHDFTPRNLDRMRRDALIMERLTSSKHVIDIYAFCGTSSFSEYGEGRDIAGSIWPARGNTSGLTQFEKLHIATQASLGLSDLHSFDSEDEASVAHTDISPNQFIKVNGTFKLNDFNRARFIPFENRGNSSIACNYKVGNNPGKNRAPEEYKLEPQSEKEYPFDGLGENETKKLVIDGHRPTFYEDIWNSFDPVDQALKSIMIRCHEQDPKDRPTAREVATFLVRKVQEIDPGHHFLYNK